MNTWKIWQKMIVCLLISVIGYGVVLILKQPLIGMREAPWFNFYYFECVLVWLLVIVISVAVISQDFGEWLCNFVYNILWADPFWAFWSKSNVPGNTLSLVAIVLVFNAVTYGPGSPQVDLAAKKHGVEKYVTDISQPQAKNAVTSIKSAINYLSVGFTGQELIGDSPQKSKSAKKFLPRYKKGWWQIWSALIAIIIAVPIFVWGRRDEMHERISAIADWFKAKPETSGSATNSSSGTGGNALIKKLLQRTGTGDQITNHVFGEFLTRGMEMIFGNVAKIMKKY